MSHRHSKLNSLRIGSPTNYDSSHSRLDSDRTYDLVPKSESLKISDFNSDVFSWRLGARY